MCGSSRDYCTFSDVWCSNPLNEKQSYWSTDTYNGEPDCNSKGRYECDNTCNKYFQMFIAKYSFELYTNLIHQITFTITDVISCGNSIISPSCNLCPKVNHTEFHIGCGGNCKFEETTGICKDECMYFLITLSLKYSF